MALRLAGVDVPVVVLAGFAPGQVGLLARHRLTPIVSTTGQLDSLSSASERPPSAHVKVDTGMSRLGFTPDAFVRGGRCGSPTAGVEVDGVMTHLASADEYNDTTARQLDRFDAAVAAPGGPRAPPEARARGEQRRACPRGDPRTRWRGPGLLLYGLRPAPALPDGQRAAGDDGLGATSRSSRTCPRARPSRTVGASSRPDPRASRRSRWAMPTASRDGRDERARRVRDAWPAGSVAGTVCMDLDHARRHG